MKLIEHSRLRELLTYDRDTGYFYWLVSKGAVRCGSRAGYLKADGYYRVTVDRQIYLLHRLGWFYHHGFWPPDQLDHIDGNTKNNRISNLRMSDYQRNQHNAKRRKDNTTGKTGVGKLRSGKYRAYIRVNQQQMHLGTFTNLQDAIRCRLMAEQQYQPARARPS